MRIYRFRVLIDHPSEAFRDIEIGSEQSFLEFHKAVKDAFAFIGHEMACFHVSDEEWNKGAEIPLADLGFGMDGDEAPALMHEVLISDHIRSTSQRFIYVYDYLHMWLFMVELIAATDPMPGVDYPRVVMSMGTAPDEHSKETDLSEGILDDDDPYSAGPEEYGTDDDEDGEGFDEEDDEALGRHGNIDDLGDEYR
jgi:hypothetical protein